MGPHTHTPHLHTFFHIIITLFLLKKKGERVREGEKKEEGEEGGSIKTL